MISKKEGVSERDDEDIPWAYGDSKSINLGTINHHLSIKQNKTMDSIIKDCDRFNFAIVIMTKIIQDRKYFVLHSIKISYGIRQEF